MKSLEDSSYTLLPDTSDLSVEVEVPRHYERSRHLEVKYITLCSACGVAAIILAGTWLIWSGIISPRHLFEGTPNPYEQFGHLRFNASDPLASTWVPFDTAVPPAPDWMSHIRVAANLPFPVINDTYGIEMRDRVNTDAAGRHSDVYPNALLDVETQTRLRQESLGQLKHLQDKTILMLGDSLDRNTVWFLAQNLASEESLYHPQYANASDVNFRNHTDVWEVGAIPHLLKLRGAVNMDVTNCFFYGSDETDFFSFQGEYHGPARAEDRISQLCKPYTEQLEYPVSMIQYQSGMWDLALFGRQDALNDRSSHIEEPLEEERLEWWRNRTISTIRSIKEAWPGVPIVYRTIHRPATEKSYNDFTWDTKKGGGKNLFTDVRATQLRQLQLAIAKEENLHVWDFGQVFEGFQKYTNKIHPLDYPGGIIMSNALLHYAWLVQQ